MFYKYRLAPCHTLKFYVLYVYVYMTGVCIVTIICY